MASKASFSNITQLQKYNQEDLQVEDLSIDDHELEDQKVKASLEVDDNQQKSISLENITDPRILEQVKSFQEQFKDCNIQICQRDQIKIIIVNVNNRSHHPKKNVQNVLTNPQKLKKTQCLLDDILGDNNQRQQMKSINQNNKNKKSMQQINQQCNKDMGGKKITQKVFN